MSFTNAWVGEASGLGCRDFQRLPPALLIGSLLAVKLTGGNGVSPDGRSHAWLRIVDEDLDPDEITRQFGVEATRQWRRGDLRGNGTRGHQHSDGGWMLGTDWLDTDDLNVVLAQLLDLVAPFADQLQALGAAGVADVFCFWESKVSSGPWLTPEIMGGCSAIGLEVVIDAYFSDDDDDATWRARVRSALGKRLRTPG